MTDTEKFFRVVLVFSYHIVAVAMLNSVSEVGNSTFHMTELEEGLLVVPLFKLYASGFPPVPDLFYYGVVEPWYHLLVSNASGLQWGMGIQSIPKNLVVSSNTVIWRQGVEVI